MVFLVYFRHFLDKTACFGVRISPKTRSSFLFGRLGHLMAYWPEAAKYLFLNLFWGSLFFRFLGPYNNRFTSEHGRRRRPGKDGAGVSLARGLRTQAP